IHVKMGDSNGLAEGNCCRSSGIFTLHDSSGGCMRRFFGLLGLLALGAIPARAQITPRYEVGAGFDFTLAGPQTLTSSTATPRLNMYGWNTNGVYNLNRYVGVAVDLSGVYNVQTSPNENIGNATTQSYPFLVGARGYPLGHHKFTPFAQILFGGAYQRLSAPLLNPFPAAIISNVGYAWEGGVGVDYTIRDHWAIRLLEVDFLNTHFNGSGQGDERATIGVVYRFGVAGVRRKKK
ncbi:MAG: outer membrane beta-barrel protein, partial [Candidatus Acidiferrales bacterium]